MTWLVTNTFGHQHRCNRRTWTMNILVIQGSFWQKMTVILVPNNGHSSYHPEILIILGSLLGPIISKKFVIQTKWAISRASLYFLQNFWNPTWRSISISVNNRYILSMGLFCLIQWVYQIDREQKAYSDRENWELTEKNGTDREKWENKIDSETRAHRIFTQICDRL